MSRRDAATSEPPADGLTHGRASTSSSPSFCTGIRSAFCTPSHRENAPSTAHRDSRDILPLQRLGRIPAWRAKAHEIVEHYGSREEQRHIATLRDFGMEAIFGDPEDRPCELLPPEAFPTPEEVRPEPELRRGGGTPDEETGPDCRTVC